MMNLEKPRLIVLDCDGVLFDSLEANRAYYNAILERAGRPPLKEEDLKFVHMHSVDECLRYLANGDIDLYEQLKEIGRSLPYSQFFSYLKPEPGLYDFLSWAKERFYVALCTNRTTSTIPLLKHFNLLEFFHLIRTALEYPKHDPRALSTILEAFKVKPKETLYVGDSEVDAKLCQAVGVPLIAYKNKSLPAIHCVNDFWELLTFLQQFRVA
jgi:HAD superfamily hydrolase (TIGR01509 family)